MTPALRRRFAAITTAVLAAALLSVSMLAASGPATAATTAPTTAVPTATTSTTRTTWTCQPALPAVSSVTATSVTWGIPSNPCPSVGSTVRLYTSLADAQAGTNIAATGFADFGITTLTVNGLKSNTDYWWSFGSTLPIGGPTRTLQSTTITTTTIATTGTTTTSTTTRTTSTCQPALPAVSSVTTTSITWGIPAIPCASVGSTVRLYTSLADAQAGTNVAATGFADFGITSLTVNGLKSGTDYWWSFGSTLPIGGPTRTAASTTTTTWTTSTSTCTGTSPYGLVGRTSNALTWSPGSSCYPQAIFGVRLYDSAARTNLVRTVSGTRTSGTLTICGLQPDTDYWANFDFNSSGGPYRTLPSGSPGCPSTNTTTISTSTTTTTQSAACTATYKILGQWQGGFHGEVSITAGSSPISGWTVTWTLAAGQTITQSWNATLTTSGGAISAKSLSWNGPQSAGAGTSFGFLGTWSGSNPVPAVTCTSA